MKFRIFCGLLVSSVLVSAATPGELRFSIPAAPRTFNPLEVSDQSSELIRYLTGGVLVRVNRQTGEIRPELAASWEVTAGGRTVTFHLRPGLKFSDGQPLTAADVARTLNEALDPKRAAPVGDLFRSQQGNPEVRVLSPLDIQVHYARPKAAIDSLFDSLAVMPPNSPKLPPSAGPFFVTEYRPGEYVQLSRNPNYWKCDEHGHHLPYLNSIRIDIQPNRDIEMTRFLRGEYQFINQPDVESFERVRREQPAAALNSGPSLDSEFLWFNQTPSAAVPEWKQKWFESPAFRHAVSLSIRRDDIARIVYRGHAHPASGPVSPSNRLWFNTSLNPLPFDADKAKKLLTAEGFTLQRDVLRDRGGHEVEFSLITNSDNQLRREMAAVIQDDLRRIGIRVNIVALDFGSLIERITKTHQYEGALLGLANVEADPSEEMNVWLSSGEMHAWRPLQKSPATAWEARIDELELAQASEPSPVLRRKMVDEFQRVVVDQEPLIYLVNPDYLAAVSPSLRGTKPAPAAPQILWNIEWLRLGN